MSMPRITLLALCLVPAWMASCLGADGPPDGPLRDVVYGRKGGLALTLDIYRPTSLPNGAGVLWLSSESFQSTDGDDRLYADLRARGYVVFTVRHGSAPIFTAEESVSDAHRAVRFLRRNAGRYGIDSERLSVVGISSGGTLAAHVGACGGAGPEFPRPDVTRTGRYDPIERESSRVAAFVSIYGPTDFLNYGEARRPVTDTAVSHFRPSRSRIPRRLLPIPRLRTILPEVAHDI